MQREAGQRRLPGEDVVVDPESTESVNAKFS